MHLDSLEGDRRRGEKKSTSQGEVTKAVELNEQKEHTLMGR
jgi:hypothetical protein